MKTARQWLAVAGVAIVAAAAAAGPADAQDLADGDDWLRASDAERTAYLLGISNMISVGVAYDERNSPDTPGTFSHRAKAGLGGTSIAAALDVVDDYYRDNPGDLDKPVLSVIWTEIAEPAFEAEGM